MAAGVSINHDMTRPLYLIVLLSLTWQCVRCTAFVTVPYNTTADVYSDYTCPIECMCYKTNETTNGPLLWINCTVDYFSPHLATLIRMISSPLTGYAFFTCSYTSASSFDLPPDSSLWDGAFQALGQLKALVFEQCKFKRIPKNGFKGLGSLTQLIIREASITDLDPGLLTYLPQLDILELSYCSLTHLFPVCTAGSLRVLNISGNHLQSLDNAGLRCFDESFSHLETLDVNNNFITEIPQWMSQSLPNLYHLGIADNYISTFDVSPLIKLNKLTFLDFSNNSLTSISSSFFKGITNLLVLGMSNNKVSMFPRSLLANLSVLQQIEISFMDLDDTVWMELTELRQLVHLNMSGNKLASINADVMSQFLRLQYCYLSHNKIVSFPRTVFEYQVNLNTLDLSFNEIPEIPSTAFKNQIFLKHLYLQHNIITTIGSETFSQLKELLSFDISNNGISSLPADSFFGLTQVVHFDLSSNNVTHIDGDSFSKSLQITHMNLSHNLLTEMATVSQILHLSILDISYNKISSLSPSFLLDLHDLTAFYASHNEIKSLPIKLFKGCENLKTVDLSYNSINQLDEAIFSSAIRVKMVDLSHNEISDINTVFSGLKDIESVDLSSNRLTKVLRGQLPYMIKHINLARNKIMFISAHTFKSLSKIRTVDLSVNMLTSLNRMDVEIAFNLGYLPMFIIRDNPFVCDCKLGWLKDWSMGKLKDMLTLPSFVLNSGLMCRSPFYSGYQILQRLSRSEFLCPYRSHCEESCMCCDYACYCKYVCPSACQCYIGGDYWHVHHVQCSSANLTTVPTGLPEGATDLRLDGNNIQALHKHEFLALKRVENLYLNGSQIDTIENNTFRGLKSVKRLYLHDNHLTVVYSITFLGLESLEELYLNNNDIHFIDVQAFFSHPALGVINIQGNALTTISINDLLALTNRTLVGGGKTKLYLSGNRWSCDLDFACKFLSFVQKNSEFIADMSNIDCIPSEATDQAIRRVLVDLQPELCSSNLTNYENMTRQSMEAPSSSTEVYVLIAVCVIVVFAITLLIVAYANRHLLQVLCFTKFGFRVFKMAKPTDDNERPYDAFISYSNKDEDFVIRQLAPRLENGDKKFNLCVHYRDFPVGACIAETIVRSVEASKRTILVVSDNFLDSEWCRFEFQTAHQQVLNERRNRVILILLHDLDSDKLDRTLKVYMRTRTYLKYDDPWFWERLMFAMPDVRHQKGNMGHQNPRNVGHLGRNNHVLGDPHGESLRNRNCGESIHNDMYEIPVLDSPGAHYQLANSISCSTHTNSAYHNSDVSDSLSGYHNGSATGSSCHYEEVGPASSSAQSTPQKQIGTPPPVPSIPKEGLVPREKLMTLKL